MSLLMRLLEWSSKNKLNKLKSCGIIIDGRVEKIIKEPFQRIMVIRVIASAKVIDGKYHFRSEIIWEEKDLILDIGDKVKILIEPENPKSYYFDPEQKEY